MNLLGEHNLSQIQNEKSDWSLKGYNEVLFCLTQTLFRVAPFLFQ
jgi:hypothetical protein